MTCTSIYIHIPFCLKRCPYCDFNTYAGQESLIPKYLQAMREEIRSLASKAEAPLRIHTVYFGGGTPSLLPVSGVSDLIETLQKYLYFEPSVEISLEANPGTLSLVYLRDLRTIGVNRLSLGVQSAQPGELQLLGRQHSYQDAVQAVKWARQADFDNLNLDLIFGLPGQTLTQWRSTLNQTLDLQPEHFSLYVLTIEPGTPMLDWASRGLISTPDPDLAADMYDLAYETLNAAGYSQYEISNFARNQPRSILPDSQFTNPHYACQHNLQYWRNLPYLGFGAGAHGYAGGIRVSNVLRPQEYLQRMLGNEFCSGAPFPHNPATLEVLPIDRETEMRETMMMGLRLTREGVSDAQFQARFGTSISIVFGEEVRRFVDWGLLVWAGDVLRLTSNGRLLGNQVFMAFV